MLWVVPLKVTVPEAEVNVPELVQLPLLVIVSAPVAVHVPPILMPPADCVVTLPFGVNLLPEYT